MNGKLPAKALVLWRIRLTAVFLLLCAVFAPFLYLFPIIATPLYIIALVRYLPRLHKSFYVSVSENIVFLQYGVYFKRQKILILKEKPIVLSVSLPLCRIMRLEALCYKASSGWFILPEAEYKGHFQND